VIKEIVKVHKKGVVVIPKSIRDALGIVEGTLLEVRIEDNKIVLKPLNLWDRVWKCCSGNAEEAEEELDREEEEFWRRRES
jgi:AbrB family looped-hinge helix DNA binding protein